MATVSRIAKIELSGLGSTRQWLATAAVQDTAAGGTVNITMTQTTTGATPPGTANSLRELRVVNDAGTTIRTFTWTEGAASESFSFSFTSDGVSGSAARCGTLELVLRVTRTVGGPTSTYDVESDGSPDTPPTSFTSSLDRGWIRGTTTLVESISNIALGGGKNSPAAYDESLFVRTTLGAVSYTARTLSVALSAGSLSGSTNSTTAAARDITFTNVCDERFAAAATVVGVTVTAPNATLTGQPFTTFTSVTDDSITVDPRLTATHLFQINSNTFQTPPSAGNVTGTRRTDETGFLAARILNARTEGVNGLTVTQSLTPRNPGTGLSGSSSTATRGGQAGWTGFLDWPQGNPGGIWDKAVDITAPSDIDDDTYLTGGTQELRLIAIDPNLRALAQIGSDSPNDHILAGATVEVDVKLIDTASTKLVTVDPDGSGVAVYTVWRRVNSSGVAQHLNTSNVWVDTHSASDTAATADRHQAIKVTDQLMYRVTKTVGADWTNDFAVVVRVERDGAPYATVAYAEIVGTANPHSRNEFDPVGLFK